MPLAAAGNCENEVVLPGMAKRVHDDASAPIAEGVGLADNVRDITIGGRCSLCLMRCTAKSVKGVLVLAAYDADDG